MTKPGLKISDLPPETVASMLEAAVDVHLEARHQVLISATPARPNILWLPVSPEALSQIAENYTVSGCIVTREGYVWRIVDPTADR